MAKFIDFKNNLSIKSEVICVVRSIDEKDSKGGKYLVFQLFDGSNEVIARMWKTQKSDVDIEKNDIVSAYIESTMFNGSLNYVVLRIEKVYDQDINDFIPCAPISTTVMYEYIIEKINSFENYTLKYISNKIYTEYKEKLLIWPAAKKMHHDIRGGLLYHTFRMLKAGEGILQNTYDDTDKEIVEAGLILHDVGKLLEMEPTETGNGEYTLDGQLFGHLYLGMRMVANVANTKEEKLDQNTIKHLLHIIASHHGKYEYGAISTPKTKEAYLVSELDMIDSRYYAFEKGESELGPGEFNIDFVKF